jgi:exosome complex RNA-binding protein Rrp4
MPSRRKFQPRIPGSAFFETNYEKRHGVPRSHSEKYSTFFGLCHVWLRRFLYVPLFSVSVSDCVFEYNYYLDNSGRYR